MADDKQKEVNQIDDEQKKKKKAKNSRAIFKRKITLNSNQAQKVMKRSIFRLKSSLFSIAVIMQIIFEEESQELEKLNSFIDEEIEDIESELNKSQVYYQSVLDNNGIDDLISYSMPLKYTLTVDCPQLNKYLKLLVLFDDVVKLIDTAWLCGEISDNEKSKAGYVIQQRLSKSAKKIIELEENIRNEAAKAGKADEVNSEAPANLTEDSETETLITEEIASA